jgi:hypothetical protein
MDNPKKTSLPDDTVESLEYMNSLRLRMEGLTHTETVKELGYKPHSTVIKRLQKLKVIFKNCA